MLRSRRRQDDDDATLELTLVPETGGENNHVSAALRVKYTPTYPEEPPVVSMRNIKGLTDYQIGELEGVVRAEAEGGDLLGAAMVYMLAEKVQDWLLDNNKPEMDMHAEMMARHAAAAAAQSSAQDEAEDGEPEAAASSLKGSRGKSGADGPEGTWRGDKAAAADEAEAGLPVTAESFAAWRVEYDAEQAALVAAAASSGGPGKKSSNVDERCKFTGRQLFEQRGGALMDLGAEGGEGGEGEGDADEEDDDFMTMRAQDDDQEGGDAAGGEGAEGDADDADDALLGGVGDEALFDDDEDLPDE